MISTDMSYKLRGIIQDTWPQLFYLNRVGITSH